jgi:hypothetical protein
VERIIYILWNDLFIFCGTINLYLLFVVFCGTIDFYILWNDRFSYFVERSIFIFCGTIHFYILWNNQFLYMLWNAIINLPMFSGTVEESTLEAIGNTPLRNSTDGNIRKSIDYVNETPDKDNHFNKICSWRPHVAEYKAMCLSIYGTERVPELMNMEKAYNFLFLQAHRPSRPAGRNKKVEVLNPKGKNRNACIFLFCGTIIPQNIKCIVPQNMKTDRSTKYNKWIVPQKYKKMYRSTKYINGSFHKI